MTPDQAMRRGLEFAVGLGYFIDSMGRIWFKLSAVTLAARTAARREADEYECLGWW